MKAYIYWLHYPEHKVFSDGYIGVSNDPKRRKKEHRKIYKKYGERTVQHIIWVGEEDNCYKIEEELRPKWNMGWNQAPGGIKPPGTLGFKFQQSSLDKKKETYRRNKSHNFYGPKINSKRIKEGTHNFVVTHTCPHCGKTGKGDVMKRWHFNKCKEN